jgi:hypothetical protein
MNLINNLRKDASILKDFSINFRNQMQAIRIASFIEEQVTPPAKASVRS